MVLLMTVEPGFGGQKFLDLVVRKIRRTRAMITARQGREGREIWLQVDGGVSDETIERGPRGRARTCSSPVLPSTVRRTRRAPCVTCARRPSALRRGPAGGYLPAD